MSRDFREDIVNLFKEYSKMDYQEHGYINPWLLSEIVEVCENYGIDFGESVDSWLLELFET